MTEKELLLLLRQYTRQELKDAKHSTNYFILPQDKLLSLAMQEDSPETRRLHLYHFSADIKDIFTEKVFNQDDEVVDIIVTQHGRFSPPIDHSHDYYELLYVYNGEFLQRISEKEFAMQSGDFCLIPPGVTHALNVQNSSVVLNILIRKKTFQDIFLNSIRGDNILSTFFLGNIYSKNINDYIIFRTLSDSLLQNTVLSLCLESITRGPYCAQMMYTELTFLFLQLLRNYENSCILPQFQHRKDGLDFSILRYMEDHYQTVTLPEIARHFHYSTQYISHRIKELTGLTFTGYLLRKRMQEAAKLLIESNIRISMVGEAIGYASHEHFIRSFKQYYHVSPNKYRIDHQNGLSDY